MIYFYRSRQVFSFDLDWVDGQVSRFNYELPTHQIGFGQTSLEPEQNHLAQGFEIVLDFRNVSEMKALEAFVSRLNGRLRGFWLPGAMWELNVVSRVDDTHFDIQAAGMEDSWDLHPCQYLWLVAGDSVAAVKILGVTSPAAGVERVQVEETLPAELDATWSVARLYFVRLDNDSLEFELETPIAATCKLTCYELPLEYSARELGDRPVWLYEFAEQAIAGSQQTWRYTSHDVQITALSHTWTPAAFSHSKIMETVHGDQDELEVTSFRFSGSPLNLFFPFAPQRRLYFTLRELRLDDGVITVRFAGEVRQVQTEGKVMTAKIATRLDAEDRQLPRLLIGKSCSYNLGDGGCLTNLASFAVVRTISAMSGTDITLSVDPSKPVNWFAGGFCVVAGGTTGREVRQIVGSNGVHLYLNAPFASVSVGAGITAYPGCDKRAATCIAKFNNYVNFGGHPFIDRNLALKAFEIKQQTPSGKK
jgi:hypothetical protein